MKMVYVMKSLMVALVACLVATVQAQPSQDEFPNQAAYDVVQVATDELIGQVTDNHELYVEDTEIFFIDVEAMLAEVIDFKRIARRVMAKHYKKAEPEQQAAFEGVFKRSLLKVYAKALLDYNSEKIVILPPRANKKVSPRRQRVDIEFYSAAGQKFPITYSMYLNTESQWKMENVIVNGVNIGLTFRNQFARLMKVNKNDIDQVVAGWNSDLEPGE